MSSPRPSLVLILKTMQPALGLRLGLQPSTCSSSTLGCLRAPNRGAAFGKNIKVNTTKKGTVVHAYIAKGARMDMAILGQPVVAICDEAPGKGGRQNYRMPLQYRPGIDSKNCFTMLQNIANIGGWKWHCRQLLRQVLS